MKNLHLPISYLFVPATMIERVPKAFECGADKVIVDLEDAVHENDKELARDNVAIFLTNQSKYPIWLRLNAVDSPYIADDLSLFQQLPSNYVEGIMLPKVKSARDIETIAKHTQKPVRGLIENPLGMANIAEIATAKGLTALSFGLLDICEQLGVNVNSEAGLMVANQLRYQLLIHSKINNLQSPIEGVYPNFYDEKGLIQRINYWQDLGFSGMMCIHPKQIKIFQQFTKPSAEQYQFAKRIVHHYKNTGQAIFALDGQMVDLPVIKQAEQMLGSYHET